VLILGIKVGWKCWLWARPNLIGLELGVWLDLVGLE
jgi:hypothetical protein